MVRLFAAIAVFAMAGADPCTPGQFGTGGIYCTDCPAGTASTTSNAAECTPCAPHEFAAIGSNQCTACDTASGMGVNYDKNGCTCQLNHCMFTETWSSCDKSCGGGFSTATLVIQSQPSACSIAAGATCPTQPAPKVCNDHSCDCKYDPWTAWTPCTKSCGGGRTQRTRKWVPDSSFAGTACADYNAEKDCNIHECAEAECHTEFVKCTMEDWTSDEAKAMPHHGYGRDTKCNMANREALRQFHCHHASNGTETAQLANQGFTLHVEHKHNFSFIGKSKFDNRDNYKCKYDRARLGKASTHGTPCECTCITHPTGCYKEGYGFTDQTSIDANTIESVDINTCSNACASHPGCFLWEFNAATKACILKPNSPTIAYVAQANSFAGKAPSNRYSLTPPHALIESGCIKAGQTIDKWQHVCRPGTYTSKTRAVDGSYVNKCIKCPSGTYNPIPGRTYCMDVPTRQAGQSLQDYFAQFDANAGASNNTAAPATAAPVTLDGYGNPV